MLLVWAVNKPLIPFEFGTITVSCSPIQPIHLFKISCIGDHQEVVTSDVRSIVSDIVIRAAASNDVALIFDFICKKADFDRSIGGFSGQLTVTTEKIYHALFSDTPLAYVLLAELREEPVGFALYGFHFSSFAGRPNLWLDDLYVEPGFRHQRIGSALMARLAEIAQANDCTHLGWNADARNTEGLRFYQRLGAEIIALPENRRFLRWHG